MTADAARHAFLAWLTQERRMAANTAEAYGHALAGFLGFLARHLGAEPDLQALAALRATDIRAWLASLSAAGLVASSRAQHLSAIRGFYRFLHRRHGVDTTQIRLVATAKARAP
ncbi:MAG TPA: site-specific integrase [Rhodopila sp.]|nr:site-specific integrase [Rhodopila sp.]